VNTRTIIKTPFVQASPEQRLASDDYAFIDGKALRTQIQCSDREIDAFAEQWAQLTLDTYMGDGGTYRYRRYGQFEKTASQSDLRLLPHEAYQQSKAVNYLNGDVARLFDPLTDDFVKSPVLYKILTYLAGIYDQVKGRPCDWNIRLHPYRIKATQEQAGQPTPEGLHRDGVTFIASMMIRRHNIRGGITTLTDTDRHPITSIELSEPLDTIAADDAATLHDVSALHPIDTDEPGIRDVLVIAFTELEANS